MNAVVQVRSKPAAVRAAPSVRGAAQIAALAPSLVVHELTSARAEALRELRSQLILRWFGEHRTLAVLGAHAHDGAGTVAANLAIVMAQLGEPTLLIDANLREPEQHRLFGLLPTVGLTDLLQNRDVHDEAIRPVPGIEHLSLLPAGPLPANPQELVSRTPLMYLMKTLPERFRAVILATPPALDCADAQVVAARARGCLLVTRRHRTRLADVERVKSQLEPGRVELVGGVIQQ
jgi:chain length determinant protein tyrosine kinase EpsG